MSAASRAEARRKAILNRGSDRLAKLTTSARGDNAPAYVHDDPPLPRTGASTFLGEDSDMPTPPARASPSPQQRAASSAHGPSSLDALFGGAGADPSVWSEEQQRQLMQALMGGGAGAPGAGASTQEGMPDLQNNPLAALLGGGQGGFPGAGAPMGKAPEPRPKSRFQKLLPLLHVIAVWGVLAFFVLFREPQVYSVVTTAADDASPWGRWWELASRKPSIEAVNWQVQTMPFFWALLTVLVGLYSLRILSGFDAIQPPSLLAMFLPQLPPPIPTLVTTGLRYLQLLMLFADDFAAAIFGLGAVVWIAGYFAS